MTLRRLEFGLGIAFLSFVGASAASAQLPDVVELPMLAPSDGVTLHGSGAAELGGKQESQHCTAALDINADGFDDVVLISDGSIYPGQRMVGDVYVVFGGSDVGAGQPLLVEDLDGTNGFRMQGIEYEGVGSSVANGGDLNGDGIDDLLIGASAHDVTFDGDEGACYILFGAPGIGASGTVVLGELDGLDGLVLRGVGPEDYFGDRVAGLGDVDGDGYDDFGVAVPRRFERWETETTSRDELIAVKLGDIDGDGDLDVVTSGGGWRLVTIRFNDGTGAFQQVETISLPYANDIFLEDMDGDNDLDLIVETLVYDTQAGTAFNHISFLPNDGSGSFGPEVRTFVGGEKFVDLALADLDGDGDLDVAASHDSQSVNVGYLRSFENDGAGGLSTLFPVIATSPSGSPGTMDIDGDGDLDVLLVDSWNDEVDVFLNTGSVFVPGPSFGSESGELSIGDLNGVGGANDVVVRTTVFFDVDSPNPTELFLDGFDASSALVIEDVTGDGTLDLVAAESDDFFWVIPGLGGGSFGQPERYRGSFPRLKYIDVGDLDGDGDLDVVALGKDSFAVVRNNGFGEFPGRDSGGAYVFFGGPSLVTGHPVLDVATMTPSQGFFINGEIGGDRFGEDITSSDLNGDGRMDVVIGSPAAGAGGRAYVLFGSPGLRGSSTTFDRDDLDGTNGFRIVDDTYPNFIAYTLAGGTDLDDDGFDDLLLGAPLADFAGTEDVGRTLLVYGSAGIGATGELNLTVPDGSTTFAIHGVEVDAESSLSLAFAGDINGSGSTDLFIGTRLRTINGQESGEAALIHTFPDVRPDTANLWVDTLLNWCGSSLRGGSGEQAATAIGPAGDFNRDGFDDIVITAPYVRPAGGSNIDGAAYIVYGRSEVDTVRFVGHPVQGKAPRLVSFTDTSTLAATTWSWDFGDGGMSNQQHATHAYQQPGTYDVELTITGPFGSETLVRDEYVQLGAAGPKASFVATPKRGARPEVAVVFTNTSTGNATEWRWDFGDGQTSTDMHPAHVYTEPGAHTVILTAIGPDGFDVRREEDLIVVPKKLRGVESYR